MFRHGGLCVQAEASGILRQVSGVGVDQSSACPILLSQPNLFSKTDPAPDAHHDHAASHRHACTFQPFEVLRTSVVGKDQAPLQRERQGKVVGPRVTLATQMSCLLLTVVLPVALYGQ